MAAIATSPAMMKYATTGSLIGLLSLVPVSAMKMTSSEMCMTKATTCDTPTLAAAIAAGIFRRCR